MKELCCRWGGAEHKEDELRDAASGEDEAEAEAGPALPCFAVGPVACLLCFAAASSHACPASLLALPCFVVGPIEVPRVTGGHRAAIESHANRLPIEDPPPPPWPGLGKEGHEEDAPGWREEKKGASRRWHYSPVERERPPGTRELSLMRSPV
jgi:hypothetical protein